MSYGPNITEQFHRAATFVDRILNGAKQADIPWPDDSPLAAAAVRSGHRVTLPERGDPVGTPNLAFPGPTCYEIPVIGPDDFRRTLGHFATGVTIVTTCDAEAAPAGLTVSAFTSLSLDPPLVLVCVDHKSQSYPALRDHGRFAVNVLTTGQEVLSRRFASTRLDKFEGVPYRMSELGLPLLEAALAQLECRTVRAHVEGDHTIFVGMVERVHVGTGDPLLYYRGQYNRLQGGPS